MYSCYQQRAKPAHCSVAHEWGARKIITCFMKDTVENVVICERSLGWGLDVLEGDAARRGRAGLCVPAGLRNGERRWGWPVFFGPLSFPPMLVRSPGRLLCCHCQVTCLDHSSSRPVPPKHPLMRGRLGCPCVPWLVLHINRFEGWETLKSNRRRKQVRVFNPFCSLVTHEKSLQMSFYLCKIRNTRGMKFALHSVSLEATEMSQLSKKQPGCAETALLLVTGS